MQGVFVWLIVLYVSFVLLQMRWISSGMAAPQVIPMTIAAYRATVAMADVRSAPAVLTSPTRYDPHALLMACWRSTWVHGALTRANMELLPSPTEAWAACVLGVSVQHAWSCGTLPFHAGVALKTWPTYSSPSSLSGFQLNLPTIIMRTLLDFSFTGPYYTWAPTYKLFFVGYYKYVLEGGCVLWTNLSNGCA